MADASTLLVAIGVGIVVLGVVAGRFAPTVAMVVTILLVPLRVDVLPTAHFATLFLCGAALGRSREIFQVLTHERAFLVATLALPVWILASVVWARQPMFVWGLLGKWLMVVVAAWFAAADRATSPQPLVLGTVVSVVPNALFGLGERMHWVGPLGDPAELQARGISWFGDVRGRALFWHPNRLGEFLEQAGLLVAGGGFGGVVPWVAAIGVVAAAAGVWATGSKGSFAAIGGGVALVVGWMLARRYAGAASGIRLGRVGAVVGLAVVAAAGVGAYAFFAHGGLTTRSIVYEHAFDVIQQRPWLGFGGGNWSLLVGQASLDVSRFWFSGHAHSLPLHVWAELGIVGVALLFAFFGVPLVVGARRFSRVRDDWYGVGVGAAVGASALFAHNFVHYFLRDAIDGIFTGLLLGTVIAVARRARNDTL